MAGWALVAAVPLAAYAGGVGTDQVIAAAALVGGRGTAKYVPLWTGSTTLGNSRIYDNGNVGIGTTSPLAALQVAKDVAISGGYGQIEAVGATNKAKRTTLGFDTSSNFGWIQPVETGVGYRNLALVPKGGNMGIGTTSPTALLTLNTTNGVSAIARFYYDQGIYPNIYGDLFHGGDASGLTLQSRGSTGAEPGSGDISLWTAVSGTPSEKMRVMGNGNVGIGRMSPGAKLDVAGEIRSSSAYKLNLYAASDSAASVSYDPAYANLILSSDYSGGSVGAAYGGILFNTKDTGRMSQTRVSIAPNGNVGIGTTTPAQKLEVNGILRVSSPSTNADIELNSMERPTIYPGPSAPANLPIQVRSNGTAVLQLNNDNSGGVTMVVGGGNVGIGTTNPTQRLHVVGNVTANDYLFNSDARLKADIAPLENAGKGIACLEGVTYRWSDPNEPQDLQVGLIAQDVERCFPELVTTAPDGYKSVSYSRLVAPLIENAKEQQRELTRLKAEQATTIARLARIEALLTSRR